MNFRGMKAALHTLGCKANACETEMMRSMLENAGFEIVPFEWRADVYVVNTCTVTNIADKKSRQMVRRARKMNPNAIICASGCYVRNGMGENAKKLDADVLLPVGREGDLINELKKHLFKSAGSSIQEVEDVKSIDKSIHIHIDGSIDKTIDKFIGKTRDESAGKTRDESAGKTIKTNTDIDSDEADNKCLSLIEACESLEETKEGDTSLGHCETRQESGTGDGDTNASLSATGDRTRSYIKVQDGCNMFCSYCIIPYVRGHVRSRTIDDVFREAEALSLKGIKEIVLTGIHLSSYGTDFKRPSLNSEAANQSPVDGLACSLDDEAASFLSKDGPFDKQNATGGHWQEKSKIVELLEALSDIDKIERIRLGSLEPTIITDRFLRRLKDLRRVCPHFHLSLQSGSDSVLKRMGRKYTVEDYLERIALLREYFDRPAITTDLIVGFPYEGEEEFLQTVELLRRAKFYETHIFRYSDREGTTACKMGGKITESVKKRRSIILQQLNNQNRENYIRSFNGEQVSVLVEEEAVIDIYGYIHVPNAAFSGIKIKWNMRKLNQEEKLYTGYTERYIRVFIISRENLLGKMIKGKLIVETLPFLEYT